MKDAVWSWKIYELGNHHIMKEFDGRFRTNCEENIVLEMKRQHDSGTEIGGRVSYL